MTSLHVHQSEAFFDGVLAICVFTHAHYGNVEFIRSIYPFKNLVFYGPEEAPSGVHACNHGSGHYLYRAMLAAMRDYPGHAAYLLFHDDFILNYWNLRRLEKKKLWIGPASRIASKEIGGFPDWCWWNGASGSAALERAWPHLPSWALENLRANVPYVGTPVVAGFADCYLVPARFVESFKEMFNIFSEAEVFLEIATHTGMLCLGDRDNLEILNILPHTNVLQGLDWRSCYSETYDGVHPVKLSDEANRDAIERIFCRHILRS